MRPSGGKRTSAPGPSHAITTAWRSTKPRSAIEFLSAVTARWWRRCALGTARTSRPGPRSRKMFRRTRWEWRADGRRTSPGGRRGGGGKGRGPVVRKAARSRSAARKLRAERKQNRDGAQKENPRIVPAVRSPSQKQNRYFSG